VNVFWLVIYYLLALFFLLLLVRLVFEVVKSFAREWFPKGILALILEAVFSITDPPIKLLRKLIPPLRIGQIQFDLALLILFILVSVLQSVVARLAVGALF
jgi:YggT family protein